MPATAGMIDGRLSLAVIWEGFLLALVAGFLGASLSGLLGFAVDADGRAAGEEVGRPLEGAEVVRLKSRWSDTPGSR